MIHDQISNFVGIFKQAITSNRSSIIVPLNKTTLVLAAVLQQEGIVLNYAVHNISTTVEIWVRQVAKEFALSDICVISKPSKRVYWPVAKLKQKVLKEGGYYLVSTNQGVLTSNEALKRNISGEIWIQLYK